MERVVRWSVQVFREDEAGRLRRAGRIACEDEAEAREASYVWSTEVDGTAALCTAEDRSGTVWTTTLLETHGQVPAPETWL